MPHIKSLLIEFPDSDTETDSDSGSPSSSRPTSIDSLNSMSLIRSMKLRETNSKKIIEDYIDELIKRKSRESASRHTISKMKSSLYKIYEKMINPTNYMTDDFIQTQFDSIKKSRQRQLQLLSGRDLTYITNFYSKNNQIGDRGKKQFLKVYSLMNVTNIDELYAIMSKLISEIYFNIRAYDIRKQCGLILPKILRYGIVKDNNYDNIVKVYIAMEYIDLQTFNSITATDDRDKMIEFFRRLYRINKCLERNNIYHNDIHEENVFYKSRTLDNSDSDSIGDILLIDYGESLARQDRFPDEKLRTLFSRFLPANVDFKTTIIDNYNKKTSGKIIKLTTRKKVKKRHVKKTMIKKDKRIRIKKDKKTRVKNKK